MALDLLSNHVLTPNKENRSPNTRSGLLCIMEKFWPVKDISFTLLFDSGGEMGDLLRASSRRTVEKKLGEREVLGKTSLFASLKGSESAQREAHDETAPLRFDAIPGDCTSTQIFAEYGEKEIGTDGSITMFDAHGFMIFPNSFKECTFSKSTITVCIEETNFSELTQHIEC